LKEKLLENSQRTAERPQYFEWVVLLLSFCTRRLELIWLELKELLAMGSLVSPIG
jgi:hypothetical protein